MTTTPHETPLDVALRAAERVRAAALQPNPTALEAAQVEAGLTTMVAWATLSIAESLALIAARPLPL